MSIIELQNVSLDYVLHSYTNHSIKKAFIDLFRRQKKESQPRKQATYRAIKNLSLNIVDGDRIGLIGRNGAGKSTLLRMMSGIYEPSDGELRVQGNVSSLLDMSIGMAGEATGNENIINLGILLGKTKEVMQSKRKLIAEFSELGDFLNSPVRTYSDGMKLRLAFAVVTTIEPDILLLDEIVGVGDAFFMEKAKQRLDSLIDNSNILVLSSHDNDLIRRFCNKVLLLNEGNCTFFGDVEEGLKLHASQS